MPHSETFGPFELVEQIGEGGMGVVYRADHRTAGTPAAIKILTADYAARQEYRQAFRREAQALAKLTHPSIATILDFGTLAGPVDRPDAHFEADTPWLAMEFVDGKPLAEAIDNWQWPEVEDFLLTLLDALAHAHANDVIHRDLKPSNMLVVESEEATIEVKLVDFGIARVLDEEERAERGDRVRGTPKYMAPEQVLGHRRDQGPWTDLYALGCLIWRLLCQQAPFAGTTTRETLQRHLSNRPTAFEPVIEVPDKLHDWLRRMLVKDPADRFRRAADAAWSLIRLAPPPASESDSRLKTTMRMTAIDASDAPEMAPTETSSSFLEKTEESDSHADRATTISTPSDHPFTAEAPEVDQPDRPPIEELVDELAITPEPPPLPDDWRRGDTVDHRPPVAGGGLELFGLRTIPLVDREAERDLLWQELSAVRRTDSPRLVMLTGPAGSGKSRLIEWLTRRVGELGAAQVMRATHSLTENARDGVGPMFGRHFEYLGMTWTRAFERLRGALGRLGIPDESVIHDAAGLLGMVDLPMDQNAREVAGFQGRREAHVAIRRVLGRIAEERPLILWLDDLAWSPRSIELARFLLDHPPDASFPVLIVGTGRSDAFDAHPDREQTLRQVDGSVTWMEVPPLDRPNLRRLVEQTLELDDALVDEIVERTEGTPLFAIQLLGEWVEGGLLEAGPSGFVLADRADDSIPEDLQQLWLHRVEAIVAPLDGDARRAVEAAAALGKQVAAQEWYATCEHLGLRVPYGLEGTLIEAGLAEPADEGWRFTHRMLVESIEREADRTGRLADYHRAIAETLEALYPEQAKQTARRRADHYRRCDDPSLALEPMRLQAQHLRETGEFHDMLELLDRRDRLCDRLGLADEDRRRLQADILRLWAYNRFGETDRAAQLLDRIEPIIRRKGWHRELGDALMVRSRMASGDGDLEESIACSRSAQTHYETAGDTRGLAHAHTGQAFVHLRRGEYPRSIEAYDRAIALYDELGDTPSRVSAQAKKMMVRVAQKRFEDVWRDHSELLDEAQSIGARQQEATLWNIAGEAARYQERWQQARGCYRRARDIWTELDSRIRHIAELNLAMVELGAGHFAEARRRFESVEEGMRRAGLPSRLLRVFLGQAGCAAGQNDWAGWERALERVERQLEENQDRNTDDPWLAEIAAGHAADRGHTDRARRMYRLARRLWHDIDEPEQAEAVDRTLATLD